MSLIINSEIMKWAREERRYSLEQAAEKLSKPVHVIQEWEHNGATLTFVELKKVSTAYRRQISAFFLDNVPEKTKIPQERRNMRTTEENLNPETMLAIRRTSRYLKVVRQLSSAEYLVSQYKWLDEIKGIRNTEELAAYMRGILDISVDAQKRFNTPDEALRKWREAFENKLGIYTFSFLMPYREIDGFSYIESGVPYAITVNSRNSKRRNVYTLFHELAHIVEGSSGMCLTNKGTNNASDPERRCDNFAALFLMPRSEMKNPVSFDELRKYASDLSVSTESYARRLKDLNLIDFNQMEILIGKIPIKRNKPSGQMKIPPLVMSKSRRGEKFFNLVVDAYSEGKITSSAASDILAVKTSRVDSL